MPNKDDLFRKVPNEFLEKAEEEKEGIVELSKVQSMIDNTLEEFKKFLIPAGSIIPLHHVTLGGNENRNPIFWNNKEPDLNWLLCDGLSDGMGGNVPDLRGRFILGSDNKKYLEGNIGGSESISFTLNTNKSGTGCSIYGNYTGVSVQATTLNVNQIPSHNHYIDVRLNWRDCSYIRPHDGSPLFWDRAIAGATGNTGGSQSHSHGISDPTHTHSIYDPTHSHSGSGSATFLPPYYVLAYFVKLPIIS